MVPGLFDYAAFFIMGLCVGSCLEQNIATGVTNSERPPLAGQIVTGVKTAVRLQPEPTAYLTPVAARQASEGRPNKTTSKKKENGGHRRLQFGLLCQRQEHGGRRSAAPAQ